MLKNLKTILRLLLRNNTDVDLYLKCLFFVYRTKQTIGKNKNYFITIEQLEILAEGDIPEKYVE